MSILYRQRDGSEGPGIPHELAVIVSDSIAAPATFLIVQQIVLARRAKRRCVLVGIAHGFEYYRAVLRKQGVQLRNPQDQDSCVFIDGIAAILAGQPLQTLQAEIAKWLSKDALIMIDDISALQYAGVEERAILLWHRDLLALIRESSCSLLAVVHDNTDSARGFAAPAQSDVFLQRQLIQLCDIWIQTRSLRSQMTGELVIHRGPTLDQEGPLVSYSRSKPLQYRLEESGPVYFAKGTDRGFL